MANVKPVRFLYSGNDTIGFSELQSGETIDFSDIEVISGTDVKTINSTSILGSGDITVQPTLVSGTNIRTINNNTLLGSTNISVQEVLVSGTNIKTINGSSLLGSGNITIEGGTGGSETFNPFLLAGM